MSRSRVNHLSTLIALAALLLLPVGSGLAEAETGGHRAHQPARGVHMPRAICHQYCYGADRQLARVDVSHREHVHTIAIPTASAFDAQDAAIGAAAGSGATLIVLAVFSRRRRAHTNEPASAQPAQPPAGH
jgi:hypothetical protein